MFVCFKGWLLLMPDERVRICSESPLQTPLHGLGSETRALIHFTGSLKQDWSTLVPLPPYHQAWFGVVCVRISADLSVKTWIYTEVLNTSLARIKCTYSSGFIQEYLTFLSCFWSITLCLHQKILNGIYHSVSYSTREKGALSPWPKLAHYGATCCNMVGPGPGQGQERHWNRSELEKFHIVPTLKVILT